MGSRQQGMAGSEEATAMTDLLLMVLVLGAAGARRGSRGALRQQMAESNRCSDGTRPPVARPRLPLSGHHHSPPSQRWCSLARTGSRSAARFRPAYCPAQVSTY